MKTIAQITSEHHLLLSLMKKWVVFGTNAAYVPPATYYASLRQLTSESRNAILFCASEKLTAPPSPRPSRKAFSVRRTETGEPQS